MRITDRTFDCWYWKERYISDEWCLYERTGGPWYGMGGRTAFRDIEAPVRTTEPQHPSTCLACLTPAYHSYRPFISSNRSSLRYDEPLLFVLLNFSDFSWPTSHYYSSRSNSPHHHKYNSGQLTQLTHQTNKQTKCVFFIYFSINTTLGNSLNERIKQINRRSVFFLLANKWSVATRAPVRAYKSICFVYFGNWSNSIWKQL